MLGKEEIEDRRALKFCVAGVREDMLYATRKVRFQAVNEEDPGKVQIQLFHVNVMVKE